MRKTTLIISSLLAAVVTTGCQPNLIKLDTAGAELAASANEWSCVSDSNSGLIWERKAENGKRWWNARFTNTTNMGSEPPTAARGICHYPGGGSDLVMDESCHTEAYVGYVNGLALCGHDDWRVPTLDEVQTILHSVLPSPYFNTVFFPYPEMYNVWTGTPDVANPGGQAMRFYLLHAISPVSQARSTPMAVQLVRGQLKN